MRQLGVHGDGRSARICVLLELLSGMEGFNNGTEFVIFVNDPHVLEHSNLVVVISSISPIPIAFSLLVSQG